MPTKSNQRIKNLEDENNDLLIEIEYLDDSIRDKEDELNKLYKKVQILNKNVKSRLSKFITKTQADLLYEPL